MGQSAHTSRAHSSPCVSTQQGAPRRTGRQSPGEHFCSPGPPAARALRHMRAKTQMGLRTCMPAQRTWCARSVRMVCVCRTGSAYLPVQLEQLQRSRWWPSSRNDAACTRQQAGGVAMQRQEAMADGNGGQVSRPLAGMPAVHVTGRGKPCACRSRGCLSDAPVQHERAGAARKRRSMAPAPSASGPSDAPGAHQGVQAVVTGHHDAAGAILEQRGRRMAPRRRR